MTTKRVFLLPALILAVVFSCTYVSDWPSIKGRDIRLTLLHTTDIHSRILPYDHNPIFTETKLGLAPDRGPYGGIARIAYILNRERKRAGRVLHLDSGDLFQGAPIFNRFHGEAELRTLSFAGTDAMAIGNHEFDDGPENLLQQLEDWADFPVLAANYDFESQPFSEEFRKLVLPFTVFNLQGLKVGVIGMGNTSSMNSLEDGGNSLGIVPLDPYQTVQRNINLLRGNVDIIILLSHLGLSEDERVARNVCGLDLILGGHNHVALKPPKEISYAPDDYVRDAIREIRDCTPKENQRVLIVHSQAFAKFVGRLDLVVRDGRIKSHQYTLFPIDNTVPDDPEVYEILEPYIVELNRSYDLDRVVATAVTDLSRFGRNGGDSMLGNMVAESMQYRRGVETDFAVTNSLGVRSDILEGDITMETIFNAMPFDNTITTMSLSGMEVRELFDFASRRSASRGCNSQIQISGASFTMNCATGEAEDVRVAGEDLRLDGIYELATNNYIAAGGSGFDVLKRNTTQEDTGISLRDATIDYMKDHPVLPECFENVEDISRCHSGVAVEDGRIKVVYQ